MFPMAFDGQTLASLPLSGDEHGKRVLNVLQAMVARRILPYFKRKRGTDAIVLARVSEHLAMRRLEDERGGIEVMSLLTPEGEGWVIQIHERLFDYLAFARESTSWIWPLSRRSIVLTPSARRHSWRVALPGGFRWWKVSVPEGDVT